jgi:single-stranded DNA-binding protein
MNLFLATGIYEGDKFTDNGLRFMQVSLPATNTKGQNVPVFVVPNKAAGETFDEFQPGVNVLIGGRIYISRQDYMVYIMPTQAVQLSGNVSINKVNLSGRVGAIPEQTRDDLFNFTLICQAPPQQVLGHDGEKGIGFRMTAWGDDAKRLRTRLYVGRGISLEAVMKYNTWTDKEGNTKGSYQYQVRSNMYSLFDKNKEQKDQQLKDQIVTMNNNKELEVRTVEPYQDMVAPRAPIAQVDEDSIPF